MIIESSAPTRDFPVENFHALYFTKRTFDILTTIFRAQKSDATAATRAATLRSLRAGP